MTLSHISSMCAELSWMLLWGTLPTGEAVDVGELTETCIGGKIWQKRVQIQHMTGTCQMFADRLLGRLAEMSPLAFGNAGFALCSNI